MAKTLYEDMMNLNKPSSVMRPGEYFISQQGRNAQSNIAGLTGQTINVPNIQQMQGGTPAVLPASTSYQSQVDYQPLPANVERPIIEQGGSYNMPNVARPQDDLSINPEGLPLSDIDVLNRRNALAGGGSVANRNAIKAQIERERAVGTARESAKVEDVAYNRQLALKQAGSIGAAADLKRELKMMDVNSRKDTLQTKFVQASSLLDKKAVIAETQSQSDDARKQGNMKLANQFDAGLLQMKESLASSNAMNRLQAEGKVVGSPEHRQIVQEELQAQGVKAGEITEQKITSALLKAEFEKMKTAEPEQIPIIEGNIASILGKQRNETASAKKELSNISPVNAGGNDQPAQKKEYTPAEKVKVQSVLSAIKKRMLENPNDPDAEKDFNDLYNQIHPK